MKLVLFLTYGSSLKSWSDSRIIDREMAIYQDHVNAGYEVHIISYGDTDEEEKLAAQYANIHVHYNNKKLHPRLYALLIPILHQKILRGSTVYKTNQMYGAHIAMRCKKLWDKGLVIRQGYGHYENRCKEYGKDSSQAIEAKKYEHKFLTLADSVIFTTQALATSAQQRYGLDEDKVHVVPNYIVPVTWSPAYEIRQKTEQLVISFFGRLSPEKNLENLLKAAKGLNIKFIIVGNGPEKENLKQLSLVNELNCEFIEALPQKDLKTVISKSDFFALVSKYEGHPKSLIEALYFGIPVIVSNSPGVSDVVSGKDFPIICAGDVEGLHAALRKASLMSKAERHRRGQDGRLWAEQEFSLPVIAENERKILSTT